MKTEKFTKSANFDGSTTYSPADSTSVGFYNPFCLLKKDFKFKSTEIGSIKYAFTLLEILKSINSEEKNIVSTRTIMQIASQFNLGRTATISFIAGLVEADILAKESQGVYIVNPDLVIFKTDKKQFLELKERQYSLVKEQQNIENQQNIAVANNFNINIGDIKSDVLKLLFEKKQKERDDQAFK